MELTKKQVDEIMNFSCTCKGCKNCIYTCGLYKTNPKTCYDSSDKTVEEVNNRIKQYGHVSSDSDVIKGLMIKKLIQSVIKLNIQVKCVNCDNYNLEFSSCQGCKKMSKFSPRVEMVVNVFEMVEDDLNELMGYLVEGNEKEPREV